MMGSKVEFLVVDTTAFINNAPLHEVGSEIQTVQEVVNEILNKRQLRRLVALPYDLKMKDVFQENVKFVTDFAKKTGDYPSLSATDIQVMALTYQLEKEKVGTDHLKTEPPMKREISFTQHLLNDQKETAGFYLPSKKVSNENVCETDVHAVTEKLDALNCSKEHDDSKNDDENDENVDNVNIDDILVPVKEETEEDKENNKSNNDGNSDEEGEEGEEDDDDDDEYSSDDEDDSDSDWITPQNIHEKKKEIALEEITEPMKVACITSDFAMQNVLKQIGLNVLSCDGRIIKQLRSYILRCYACFKTTSIMTKVFCPNCGNKTLKKVAFSLKDDGTQVIHISSKKRLTARGKKFSLPTPKGGRHASNPILCEDQRIPQQRPTKLAKTKNNPLDPVYIAGFSPFVTRDINSRSAMLGVREGDLKSLVRRDEITGRRKGKRK